MDKAVNFGGWQPAVRQIVGASNTVYLTFDDGPDEKGTPAVLDCLKKNNAKATFFFIAQKALKHPELVARVLREGHSIGNHSLDHNYEVFFRGQTSIKNWILKAEEIWRSLGVQETVGFRPPAGVRTPELMRATTALLIPVVLWQKRFYDTVFLFTAAKAQNSIKTLRNGDIILLHDRQKPEYLDRFISALDLYLQEISRSNWLASQLSRPLLKHQIDAK